MGQGYFSKLKKTRSVVKNIKNIRKEQGVCSCCNQSVNHIVTMCDYCYLRQEFKRLDKTQVRILKILFDIEDKKINKGVYN